MVCKTSYLPNVPQAGPIEDFRRLLDQLVLNIAEKNILWDRFKERIRKMLQVIMLRYFGSAW